MSEESNGTVIPITDATPLTALQGGRPIKFTPERMEQIKNLVERGMSREEIAETIGVTLGSLQVTCSKHGISLRRPRAPIADRIGRSGPRQPRSTAAPVRGRSARGPQANRSAIAGRHDRPTRDRGTFRQHAHQRLGRAAYR